MMVSVERANVLHQIEFDLFCVRKSIYYSKLRCDVTGTNMVYDTHIMKGYSLVVFYFTTPNANLQSLLVFTHSEIMVGSCKVSCCHSLWWGWGGGGFSQDF